MASVKGSNFYTDTMNTGYLMQKLIKLEQLFFLFALQICSNNVQKTFLLYVVQFLFV